MPEHNRRHGIQTLIDRLMRAAVADLQRLIPYYQTDHVDLVSAATLTARGYCSAGVFPEGEVNAVRVIKLNGATPDYANFRELTELPWASRWDAIAGSLAYPTSGILIDPRVREYLVLPALTSTEVLEISWLGIKRDFADAEETPFDEDEADAVADYVKARIARQIDNDLQMAGSYENSYRSARKALYLRYQGRAYIRPGRGANQAVSVGEYTPVETETFCPEESAPGEGGANAWDNLSMSWDELLTPWDSLT